ELNIHGPKELVVVDLEPVGALEIDAVEGKQVGIGNGDILSLGDFGSDGLQGWKGLPVDRTDLVKRGCGEGVEDDKLSANQLLLDDREERKVDAPDDLVALNFELAVNDFDALEPEAGDIR